MSHHRPRSLAIALLALILVVPWAPRPAHAAEPSLGDAVSLPDGTVLPPMPPEFVTPSVHEEMLIEHGGDATGAVGGIQLAPDAASATEGTVQADALVTAQGGATGPAGALPNGLRREVFGFLPYWKLDATTRSALRLDLVSTIAYFGIGVQSDGRLIRGTSTGWAGWASPAMTELMNAAHARGVRVVPTITLMSWNGDYANLSTLLNDAAARQTLVADVATIIRDRNADGVNVDFEPVPSSLRSQFTTFVRELKAGLVAAGVGSYVTVSTMAGAASWATGYDVAALTAAGAADALMVMAYDFSYAGSARAGGVAPIRSDDIYDSTDALNAHLAIVPPSKLIWGVPYYGRAWNTTSDAVNSTVRSPAQSVAFSYYWTDAGQPAGGKVLAERYGRRWDATGQVPYFVFWDAGSNGYRQGYYDDPASLRVKYDTVAARDLAGVGIWHLGMDTGVNDLWNLIGDRFVKRATRLAGADRYATAAAVSAAAFPTGVAAAYVATGATFPDALASGPAAAVAGAPVLLTQPGSLPQVTAAELSRLRPQRIYVLGGPGAVSDTVVAGLRPFATSGEVIRLAGADRYATAAAVSARTFAPGAPVAYVATGANFPDALAGGTAAGRQAGPVLLTGATSIPSATAAELSRLRPQRIVVLGGPSIVGDGVLAALRGYATSGRVDRLYGAGRYETAIEISRATTADDAASTVYIATGAAFPDGLSGTPAAARGGPLILVPSSGLTDAIATELRRLNAPQVVILGGPGVVPDAVVAQIAALWD
jgi:spore germination protein YaaH/putative cell wall-binding protein